MKLTDKNIVFVRPGRHSVGDGLYLFVSPDGKLRRWYHRYTRPNGRGVTEAGLGPWPVVTLEEAKAKVLDHRRMIRAGQDPVQVKRAERKAGTTFRQAGEAYIAAHQASWSAGTWNDNTYLLEVHGQPLHDIPVDDITPDHMRETLAPMLNTDRATRALALYKRIFEHTGHHLSFKLRHRVVHRNFPEMPYAELPEFVQRLRAIDTPVAAALEFLILTVCPTKEVLTLRRKDIDFQTRTWSVVRYKTGQPHRVPLSTRTIEILNQYDWSNISYRLALFKLMRRLDPTATVHGFRATFKTWAYEQTEYPWELIEAAMCHKVGNAVARSYLRGDALERRREIMQHWSNYCEPPPVEVKRAPALVRA